MKKISSLVAPVALLLFAGFLNAGEPVKEDFENIAQDTSAEAAGWVFFEGTGSLADMKIAAPLSKDNSSAGCLTGDPNGKDIQILKPFASPFDYAEFNHLIDYSVKVVPQSTGASVHRIFFGVQTESGKVLGLFGIAENNASATDFQFCVSDLVSSEFYPAGHLYEIRLRIDASKGLDKAKGTLQFRDLTQGNDEWTSVQGLKDVPLYLEGSWNPALWVGWYIRSSFRREIDDLTLSAS